MELRERKQWVGWTFDCRMRSGKPAKVPISPRTGRKTDPTDLQHGGRLRDAIGIYRAQQLDGIGILLGNDLAGVDLDSVITPNSGVLDPWAEVILATINTYSEISPSGLGVKCFLFGRLAGEINRQRFGQHPHVELYDRDRFFTVTGKVLAEYPKSVEHRPSELLALHRSLNDAHPRLDTQSHRDLVPHFSRIISDPEIVQMALSAKNGEKFRRLWFGDGTGYHSPSEADLALFSILAFWIGPDADRIIALAMQSNLRREKWKRGDYLCLTAQKAIDNVPLFYRARVLSQTQGNTPPNMCSKSVKDALAIACALEERDPIPHESVKQIYHPNCRKLAAVCFHLQRVKQGKPFGLDCRKAGDILCVTHTSAAWYFRQLVEIGFLQVVSVGTYHARQASEYQCGVAL